MTPTKKEIFALIEEACGTPQALEPDTDLLASGLMDSLARITLFDGLEDLGIELQPTQVSIDQLRSAERIWQMVQQISL